jgi:hypothetical protein
MGTGNVARAESIYQPLQTLGERGNPTSPSSAWPCNPVTPLARNRPITPSSLSDKAAPIGNGTAFQPAARAQACNAIGTALQNGDLAGAQQAFTTLVNSLRARSATHRSGRVRPVYNSSDAHGAGNRHQPRRQHRSDWSESRSGFQYRLRKRVCLQQRW